MTIRTGIDQGRRRLLSSLLPSGWAPSRWPRSALTRTHLASRRLIEISGPEAGAFLQGLCSNDLLGGVPAPVRYAAFLTHKGRYLFDAFVWRQADQPQPRYLLDLDVLALDAALAHIRRYRLRSKVDVADVSDRARVEHYTCPDPHVQSQLVRRLNAAQYGQAQLDPRAPALGVRCLLPAGARQDDDDLLRVFADSAERDGQYDAWLVAQGVPRHGRELIPEKTIPLEANLDLLNAIAFTKGCYLGQELIARSHFTGVIRKRMVPFVLSSKRQYDHDQGAQHHPLFPAAHIDLDWTEAPIAPGASITCGGPAEVGKVLSNLGNFGIALVRLEALYRPSAAPACGDFRLHPVLPAYWSQASPAP